jgi:hypothetical protein
MKTIWIYLLVLMNICGVLCFNPLGAAAEANIIFKDVTVQLVQTRPPVGTTTIHEYTITAVLQNIGMVDSDNITVTLKDPQPGLNATLTFQPATYALKPSEEKTFVFEDWPTSLSGTVLLNISFKPTSPTVLETEYNSRHYYYMLHIGNDTTTKKSTPGFEAPLVLLALLVFVYIQQKKK